MVTIGLVANVYNEVNALPGWLETHLPFFDDVRVLHAGPQGQHSNDGTIELLEKWRIPVQFCAIDEGFGAVRTRALRMSPCDYVMLLDADERFYPIHQILHCFGSETPQQEVDWILQSYDFRGVNLPNWENLAKLGSGLCVDLMEPYNQGARLREILENERPDAVCTIRRHWHDLSLCRPTQHWHTHPDWQMRTVRNDPSIGFGADTRIHERLDGARNVVRADFSRGPFFDHFHFHFKRMEQLQRRHDIAIYDAIHQGWVPPTATS
jgi:glycosyltransferase involved in cell wall biosynthesis